MTIAYNLLPVLNSEFPYGEIIDFSAKTEQGELSSDPNIFGENGMITGYAGNKPLVGYSKYNSIKNNDPSFLHLTVNVRKYASI